MSAVKLTAQALSISISFKYRRIHFNKTRSAIHRAALGRIERDRSRSFATGAVNGHFDTLLNTRRLRRSNGGKPFVLCLLAFFTAFWWVLELLIAEKSLLTGCPNKLLGAVDAFDRFVLEFRRAICGGLGKTSVVTKFTA